MKNVKAKRKIGKKSKKRKMLVVASVASLSLGGVFYFLNSPIFESKSKEVNVKKNAGLEYDEVRGSNDIFLRQIFIDKIIEKHGIADGAREIRYEDKKVYSNLVKGYSSMQTIFYVPEKYRGKNLETIIVVYPQAFRSASSEDEFLSLLVDHEYCHTDYVRGRVNLDFSSEHEYELLKDEIEDRIIGARGDLFELFGELHCYNRQINSFSKRKNLGEKFVRSIVSVYNSCVDSLDAMEKTPLVKYLEKNYKRKINF